MATLTFSFDTGTVPLSRIVDAFASVYRYQLTVPDHDNPGAMIPNPETKVQFARRMVRQFVIDVVKSTDVDATVATARAGVSDITLT